MKKPKNIETLRRLIEKYESIPLEKINKEWVHTLSILPYWAADANLGFSVAQNLTGFGGVISCTLCTKVRGVCSNCVYGTTDACILKPHKKTYDDISRAKTPRQLYNAFHRRANHLRKHFKDIL